MRSNTKNINLSLLVFFLKKACCIFICLYSLTMCVAGQNFTYKMFTVKDGLPGCSIMGIFEDSRGLLWISTDGGLSCYDGTTFKNYGIADGLPGYYFGYVFTEDTVGRLWFPYKEGVCLFDGTHFIRYPIDHPPDNIWVTSLVQTHNHIMRFCAGNATYELQNNRWKKLNSIPGSPNVFFNEVQELDNGSMLINYRDSLLLFNPDGSSHVIIRTNDDNPLIQSITSCGSNQFYLSTRRHLYIVKNGNPEKIHDRVLHDQSILGCYVDRRNRLWVGTIDNGIYVFEENHYQHINPAELNLKLCSVSCEDYEGNIWAATSNGLMKLTPSWVDFFSDQVNSADGSYTSAFKNKGGAIYFAHITKGFELLKDGKFISSRQLLDKPSAAMTEHWIHSFAEDGNNCLWMVDNNHDLLRINQNHCENISNKWHFHPNGSPLFYSPSDRILYAANSYGLTEIKNDFFSVDTLFTRNADQVMCISSDSSCNLWLGTEKGKIYQKSNNRYRQMNNQLNVDSVNIAKIYWSDSSTLYIATAGKGIYKFHYTAASENYEREFQITAKKGLPHDDVLDIAFDKSGVLWAATKTGIARIRFFSNGEEEIFSVTKYGTESGFKDDQLVYACLVSGNDGNIWYGTNNSLACIHGDRIKDDTIPPFIHIELVKLSDIHATWENYTDAFTPFFHLPQKPVLPYDQNDIAIDFGAVTFTSSNNLIYSYKLEGIDNDWIDNGSNTHIAFGNINPGSYTFKVRARKPLSAWSPQLAQFAFTISPPWWNTWWFMNLVGIAIVITLYLLYRYRLNQQLRLQSIRNKIAGDLHDDIGSTLNSISIYSEVAKKKDEQQDEALEMIGDASRIIIDAMSDIVWTINPENDSFAKIIFRMKSLAYNLFRAKEIEFTFDADENLNVKKLSLEDRRNFYLIFKEAINNLVKYSRATRAAITLTNDNESIRLLIQDNGAGFDTLQDHEGSGLKSMKRRAEEMKAQLKIESQIGNGTQLELILKT